MKYVNHLKRTEVSHLSLFCGVFIVSSLAVLLVGKDEIVQSGMMDRNALRLFRLPDIDKMELLFYILRERCFVLPLLFIMSTTYLGKGAGYACCAWYGVGIGAITGTAILRYGVGGMFLVLVSAFPQYLFYVPAFIICIGITKTQRKPNKRMVIQLFLIELLIIVGSLTECYINPTLIEKIIKLFGVR